jgi:hypothetical protein
MLSILILILTKETCPFRPKKDQAGSKEAPEEPAQMETAEPKAKQAPGLTDYESQLNNSWRGR